MIALWLSGIFLYKSVQVQKPKVLALRHQTARCPCPKTAFLFTLITLFLFPTKPLKAQVLKDTGDVLVEISAIISSMPGNSGNDFALPSTTDLDSWGSILHNLFAQNYTTAADTAANINYELVEFLDTTVTGHVTYYILRNTASNYWGTYVYNPNYCRSLVVQSPHPKKDYNTGKEGIYVFREAEAIFFCMSGTSRCNHTSYSSCSGTTSVCSGSTENYRISDMAHILNTVFQSTTDSLFHAFSSSVFLQLHGFTKLPSDPFIILSNGTQITPPIDYIATFKTKLENEDSLFIDSIKVAHIDLEWTRLRGFSNVQVRLVNSSVSPCDSNSTATNGRFIHMEQEKTRLRADSTGWKKVSNAIKGTLPCTPLPVSLLYFTASQTPGQTILCQWATSLESNSLYFAIERSPDASRWMEIGSVNSTGNNSSTSHYAYIDQTPLPGTSYYRLRQVDQEGAFVYSPIKAIHRQQTDITINIYPNPVENRLYIVSSQPFSKISIFTQLGQKIYTTAYAPQINTDMLNPGVYFLQLEGREKSVFYRFIKK